ncbi:methanogenesis marker 17 protein [Methanotorris formicicus]|uniref:Methanogenesis marker protein 17 n=1 Tax=Methanotorris formicicus Mc-S-70 TaxID=647171 RepID=H1KWY8_9EURY|nr:methanogenesis marker 17 protein [Methanotorris formicicus]EHP88814.1 methanogenesis marker protein 17 [Methanotorris formicicus Mc-S-70]
MAEIIVDCKDKAGKEIYTKIIQTSLEDLVLGKSILEVRMVIREDEPYFIIGVLPKKTTKLIRLRDFANIEGTKKVDGITIYKIKIEDETYLPYLLEKINIIEQPSRFEVVTDSPIDLDMVVYDSKKDFVAKVLDFMNRVFPEGMRIRKTFYGKAIVSIASEKPFEEEWLNEALKLKEELENTKIIGF